MFYYLSSANKYFAAQYRTGKSFLNFFQCVPVVLQCECQVSITGPVVTLFDILPVPVLRGKLKGRMPRKQKRRLTGGSFSKLHCNNQRCGAGPF